MRVLWMLNTGSFYPFTVERWRFVIVGISGERSFTEHMIGNYQYKPYKLQKPRKKYKTMIFV